jgi:hypothetical protein
VNAITAPTHRLKSAAFPIVVRALALTLMAGLTGYGLRLLPRLWQASWSSGVTLLAAALLIVLWLGAWIVLSRTRLDRDELHQTWLLWPKRVRAADAISVKLVDIPGLRQVVAPRLLVRRRGGGMTWFHSADPHLLRAFCAQVAQQAVDRR